jgi:hypothetical protein
MTNLGDVMTSVSRNGAWEAAMRYLNEMSELNYLTMIVCRVFEIHATASSGLLFMRKTVNRRIIESSYIMEWQFSAGCTLKSPGDSKKVEVSPCILLHRGLTRSLVLLFCGFI